MNITVIGSGRWGTCIAWYLDKLGHSVTLYGKEDSESMQAFIAQRKNDYVTFSDTMMLSCEKDSVYKADVIIISIDAQGLENLCHELEFSKLENKIYVLCMKGIENSTTRRLSEIMEQNSHPTSKTAVWIGPGHAQEFYKGIPNCMVIDSKHEDVKKFLIEEFSGGSIRFYYGADLIGNEIGAAAKNVIGIAAGMLDGLGLTSLKGALMSRGAREIARLIKSAGGNEMSAYGLCHLGDYQATVFSEYSHNRAFGESFIKGEKFSFLAEGYYTAPALIKMAAKYDVELPICNAVYEVLYNGIKPEIALGKLFERSIKKEF